MADLDAAPAGSLKGKIAFVSHKMTRTQTGASYGQFGDVRRRGPNIAATKGAAAIVIRSVGTDYHRNPHTGGTNFAEGVTPIPAAALSIPDAENLERMIRRAATDRQAGDDEAGADPAPDRHHPIGQCHRRSAGQRPCGRHDPDRRASR